MTFGQRRLEVENRVRERREREDAAPRLRDRVARLRTLSIEVDDHLGSMTMAKTRYVRHVVVERAPALFNIPCSEANCQDGGHDVTVEVMRALLAGEPEFSGEDVCYGWRGSETCDRVMHFVGRATYSGERPPTKGNGRASVR
jgi:hypothetical protein